jgi:hypothetical protein
LGKQSHTLGNERRLGISFSKYVLRLFYVGGYMLAKINDKIDELILDLQNMKVNSNAPDFVDKMLDIKQDLEILSKKVCETKEWISNGLKFFRPTFEKDKKNDE